MLLTSFTVWFASVWVHAFPSNSVHFCACKPIFLTAHVHLLDIDIWMSTSGLFPSCVIKGVTCIQEVAWGSRLRAHRIYHIPCVQPLTKSPLRASVKMAFLDVRIGPQKNPCVHLFQNRPLRAFVVKSKKKHLDLNFVFKYHVLWQRMALTEDTVTLWGSGCMRNGSGRLYTPSSYIITGFAAESGQIRKKWTFSKLRGLDICTSHYFGFWLFA